MLAGDPEVITLNILSTRFADLKIEFEGKFLLTVPRGTLFPCEKTIKIYRNSSKSFFEVLEDDADTHISKKYQKFGFIGFSDLITIKIDESNIYSIEQRQSSE